jgi:hypothetical protein
MEEQKMTQAELAVLQNWRYIHPNEVVIEVDDPLIAWEDMNNALWNLCHPSASNKYNIKLFYADGQRGPHAHLIIQGLDNENIKDKARQKYKELFLDKYCPSGDKAMCQKNHLIAEEFKEHYKYKTEKKMIGQWNHALANQIEKPLIDLAEAQTIEDEKKREERKVPLGTGITNKIIQKLLISDVAKKRGIDVNSKGFALCPFHSDSATPSLKFYDDQGKFYCYGCQAHGNIIEFDAMMEKIKEIKGDNNDRNKSD